MRDVTREAAAAALQPLFRSSLEADLADPQFRGASDELRRRHLESRIVVAPGGQGRSGFRRGLSGPLRVVMGTAAGVLLIACANVANPAPRAGRRAPAPGRGRAARAPVSTAPDLRILGFTFAVAALTGILFGLAPALRGARPEVAPTLKDQGLPSRRAARRPAATSPRRSIYNHATDSRTCAIAWST